LKGARSSAGGGSGGDGENVPPKMQKLLKQQLGLCKKGTKTKEEDRLKWGKNFLKKLNANKRQKRTHLNIQYDSKSMQQVSSIMNLERKGIKV